MSCDFEEENENVSEYSTVSKTTKSKTVIRIFYETVKIKGFCLCQPKFLLSSFLVPTLRIPGLWNQMENAAVTSLCNRTGVHFGGAVQNAHTHNAPPLASAMGLRNGRGISLQPTKPTTTTIMSAERSNLTFNRSGAAASSLCLSHFSDFG